MADKIEVRVGAKLEDGAKQAIRQDLESITVNPITITVNADTDPAKNKIDAFIKEYKNKDIKLAIDAQMLNSNASSHISNYIKKIKTTAEKTIKGINFRTAFENSGKAIEQERLRIEQAFQKIGKNVKIDVDNTVDGNGNLSGFILQIKEGDKAAQNLVYSLQKIGDKDFFVLSDSQFTAFDNADKKINTLQQRIQTLRKQADNAYVGGKISQDDYNKIVAGLNNAESMLNNVSAAAYVTQADLDEIFAELKKISDMQVDAKLNVVKESDKQKLDQFHDKVQKLKQSVEAFGKANPKILNSGTYTGLINALDDLEKSPEILNDKLGECNANFGKFKTSIVGTGRAGQTAFGKLISKSKELGTYLASSMSFEYIIRGLQSMVENVIELDSAMTDLKKTTEGSAQDYAEFLNAAAGVAQTVGSKVSDVVSSAAEWSRSGFSLDEVGELSKASNIYLNVSEYQDVSDATSSLIATMKAYGYTVGEVTGIVDAFNAVGNTTATTSAGLGDALSRAGSALSVAGNSFEESLGLIVAANDTVQNPEKVGNGLKTIALRLRNTKGELESLGEETDGAAESITKLQTQILNATEGKVNIFDNSGEFKSTYQILTELAQVWQELDTIQQANLTSWIAGATQANTFSSLMLNMSTGAQAVETALNGEGSALQENTRYMDSVQGKISQLQATFQEFSANTLNSDFMKGAVSSVTALLSGLNGTVETFGATIPLVAGKAITAFIGNFDKLKKLGGAISTISALSLDDMDVFGAVVKKTGLEDYSESLIRTALNSKQLSDAQRDAALEVLNLSNVADGAADVTSSLDDVFQGLKTSATSFWNILVANAPIVIATVAIVGLAVALKKLARSYEDSLEATREAKSVYDSTTEEITSLESELETTQSRIEELNAIAANGSLSLAEQSELEQLQQQNKALEFQISLLKEKQQFELSEVVDQAMKTLNQQTHSLAVAEEDPTADASRDVIEASELDVARYAELQKQYKETLDKWNEANQRGDAASADVLKNQLLEQEQIVEQYAASLQDRIPELIELRDILAESTNLNPTQQNALDDLNQIINNYNNVGLSEIERDLVNISSYFSSSGRSGIKAYLLEMTKSGVAASEAIGELGLTLDDLGLEESSKDNLNTYFEELALSALDAAKAVEKVDGTIEGIQAAQETENKGADYETFYDAYVAAKDLRERGLVGTDDFKTVAEFITQGIDSSAEAFDAAADKMSRYFKVNDDDKLLKSGVTNFVSDLEATGKEFAMTKQMADELGLSVEFVEMMLERMSDLDMHNFDDISWSAQSLNEAKSTLSSLKNIYDSIDKSPTKDRLGEMIGNWDFQIAQAEADLEELDTDIILQMQIEYDLATLQAQIDEAKSVAQYSGSSEKWAETIALQSQRSAISASKMGWDQEGVTVPVVYKAAGDQIATLSSQLQAALLSGDTTEVLSLQMEISNLYDVQNEVMDAFRQAHPEITAESNVEDISAALSQWMQAEGTNDVVVDIVANNQAQSLLDDVDATELSDKTITVRADTSNYEYQLAKLSQGGSVDLTQIASREKIKGTKTFVNDSGTVAINLTPVWIDDAGKEHQLTETELANYAQKIFDGAEDTMNLQVGVQYEGENAKEQAEADLGEIRTLQSALFADSETSFNIASFVEDTRPLKDQISEVNDWFNDNKENWDIKFDVSTDSITDINGQIDKTKEAIDDLKDSGGEFEIDFDAASQAQRALYLLLKRRQELEEPAIMSLKISDDSSEEYKNTITNLQSLYSKLDELEISIAMGDSRENIQALQAEIFQIGESLDAGTLIELGIDPEALDAQINALNPDITLTPDLASGAIELIRGQISSVSSQPISFATVIDYLLGSQEPPNYQEAALDYIKRSQENPSSKIASLIYAVTGIDWSGISPTIRDAIWGNHFNGTAHAQGTAHNEGTALSVGSGDWGIKKSETALINELGTEIIVRGSKYFTFNNGFPTFAKLKKGDIVFNHKQSEELLKNGYVTNSHAKIVGSARNRGTVTTLGNAYADGESNTVDWIEILLDRVQRAIDKATKKLDNTFKHFNTRMAAVADAIKATQTALSKEQSAYNEYKKLADSVKLSDNLKKQVREGALYSYDGYDDKTKELIDQYKEYYEKMLDCSDAIDELSESLSELYKQAFEIIESRYDNEFDALNNQSDLISNAIDLAEAQGLFADAQSYADLIGIQQRVRDKSEAEYAALTGQLNEAVASGAVTMYSDEWWEMYNAITEVAASIQEADIEIAELQQQMRELEWSKFDYLQDKIERVTQETDFLIGLMEDSDMFTDEGVMTDEGQATQALHAVNYDTYLKQAQQYAAEMDKINAELAQDPHNQNLIERREELLDLQQEAIENAQSEKQAIIDLVQEGIDIQVEHMQTLIDEYTEALDSAKDLYDYQNKIADASAEIASIQKQLDAYQGDMSEESRSKVQKLQVELADAQKNLEETEYEQYISDQKALLDELSTEYEAALNMRLDNVDLLLQQVIDEANTNADAIADTLRETADDVGYTLTENMDNILNGTEGKMTDVSNTLKEISKYVLAITEGAGAIETDANGNVILDDDGNTTTVISPTVKEQIYSGTPSTDSKTLSLVDESDERFELYPALNDCIPVMANYTGAIASTAEAVADLKTGQTGDVNVESSISIAIDHVEDYNDFVEKLRADPQFENMVQSMTINQLVGKSSLAKNKYKWN